RANSHAEMPFPDVTSSCPGHEMGTGHPGRSVQRSLRVLELIFKPEIPIIWFVLLATRDWHPLGRGTGTNSRGSPIHRPYGAEHRRWETRERVLRVCGLAPHSRPARKPR